MTISKFPGPRIAALVTCVPEQRFDNLADSTDFPPEEIKKVVRMAGIAARRVAGDTICSSDLCTAAAEKALDLLGWKRESIDGLILVTQSPDYFLPSTACVIHKRLGLSTACAAFDVGLGCSGYPYGLWIASMMLASGGLRRVLLLHGETPSRFCGSSDRSVALLFGDAGSATALETAGSDEVRRDWVFSLHSDGRGDKDMIIEAGGFRTPSSEDPQKHHVFMNGPAIFNFTIKRLPPLVRDTCEGASISEEDVDYFIFHQSNQYIMKHVMGKLKLPAPKVPIVLKEFGNTGGPSVPLAVTCGGLNRPGGRPIVMMLLGYGVGLSWASALVELEPGALLDHVELSNSGEDAQ